MSLISDILDIIPSRLSTLGAGEDAINRPYSGDDSPPFPYPGFDSPVDTTEMTKILQPTTTSYLSPAGVQVDLPEIAKSYGVATPAPVSASGAPQMAIQPSTSSQMLNLANTIAKGLLDVYQTQAQTKLSTAQIAAAAEASKVQAQNYVMQQLQQGKSVMVPESWLQKYAASDTATKWLTPVLIIGGVGLLGYAAYLYTKKKPVAANPSGVYKKLFKKYGVKTKTALRKHLHEKGIPFSSAMKSVGPSRRKKHRRS